MVLRYRGQIVIVSPTSVLEGTSLSEADKAPKVSDKIKSGHPNYKQGVQNLRHSQIWTPQASTRPQKCETTANLETSDADMAPKV